MPVLSDESFSGRVSLDLTPEEHSRVLAQELTDIRLAMKFRADSEGADPTNGGVFR